MVCQAAVTQGCDQKVVVMLPSMHSQLHATFTIDKAVPACKLEHTYANILTGIDEQPSEASRKHTRLCICMPAMCKCIAWAAVTYTHCPNVDCLRY